ncbi:VCBS repeat-containing protein [bacterium]|nr:VCBS repeat-containing protein [bacterium]
MKRVLLAALLIYLTDDLCAQQNGIFFEDITSASGIGNSGKTNSVAFTDVNHDGLPDILTIENSGNKLYLNNGYGKFIVQAPLASLPNDEVMYVGILGDYDQDGNLDLFVGGEESPGSATGQRPCFLFKNNGNGNFEDVSTSSKIAAISARVFSATWFDFDNDGFLDLFLGTVQESSNYFLRNQGNGTFSNLTANVGVNGFFSDTRGVAAGDYDNDGDMDIVIPNTGPTRNYFFRNDGNTFAEIAKGLGVAMESDFSHSAEFADYDNDGDLDLLVGNNDQVGPLRLFRNDSNSFIEVTALSGLDPTAPYFRGSAFADFDNDGLLDLVFVPRATNKRISIYRNQGNGKFVDATISAGIDSLLHANTLAVADYDNDGRLDIYFGTYEVEPRDRLYRNTSTARNWLNIKLVGVKSNTFGVGAWIELIAQGKKQYRQINAGYGYHTQNDFVQHFGLGNATLVDSIRIVWPSGKVQILTSLTTNQLYTVIEQDGNSSPPAVPQNLSATAGNQQITLNWQANSEPDFLRYRIYGGTSPNPTTKIDSVNGAANTTKIIAGLTNGTKYYFRITAVDNNLNQSGFSNEVNATPTSADLPPAAPQNLQATPGPAHGEITLTWEANVETDLLRYRIYGGRATAPAALLDSVAANANTSLTFSDLTIGTTYAYFLTAVDASGQAGAASNSASAAPLRDTDAPFIDMPSYSIFVDLNTDAPVRVNVTDLSQITTVHIFYRSGGEASFLNKQMILQTDGSYFRNIPSIVMTTRGAEFYLTARDVHGNLATSKRYLLRVNCAEGIINPAMQPAGTQTGNFRIFSVPLDLDDKSPQAFVAANPLLEPPDATKYRWYACDRSTGALQEYPDFSNITLTPDMGFPLLANLKNFRLKTGSGKTMSISDVHHVPLPAGWSLIGNPFNFAIPYDSLRVSDGATFELWSFNGDWQLNRAGLEPWQGYAIHLNRAATLFISPGVAGLSEDAAAHAVANNEGENWLMQIIASNGRSESRFNFAGQHAAAADEVDAWDLHQPPRLADQVQVQFQPKQIEGGLKADVRRPSVEGHTWEFTCIVNPADKLLRLTFDGVKQIPAGFEAFLVDEETETAYNLRSNNRLEFAIKNLTEKKFKLFAGNQSYVTAQAREVELYPQNYALLQNFPNPFNPATQIIYSLPEAGMVELSVYNIHGQLVAKLVNELQSAGSHTAVWQARRAGSGVYWIRLQAGKTTVMKKCLLIK